MNPMSLLTLPAANLREAYARIDAVASSGKRIERRFALAACCMAFAAAFVLSF